MKSPRGMMLDRIVQLCDDLTALGEPIAETVIESVRSSLDAKLRLAVVGAVSTGKSTLVNALVRQRVAPTASGTTTSMVTWYEYGDVEAATVEFRDGRPPRRLLLDGGAVPRELPNVRFEEVRRLRVTLPLSRLEDVVIIDTPGLADLSGHGGATERALLGVDPLGTGLERAIGDQESQSAVGEADAVLYCLSGRPEATDDSFLRRYRIASGHGSGAVNTVGLLTRADERDPSVSKGEDRVAARQKFADKLAREYPGHFSEVIAVAGLLEQAARTGQIGEPVANLVKALTAVGEVRLRNLVNLGDAPLLEAVSNDRIKQVRSILGDYGLEEGRKMALVPEGNNDDWGAHRLITWCAEHSGFERLIQVVDTKLVPRTRPIKARRALDALKRVAGQMRNRGKALALIETAELDPALHGIEELRMLQRLSEEIPDSPLRDELERMLNVSDLAERVGLPLDATPAQIRKQAFELSVLRHREGALAFDDREKAAANVLAQSYHLIATRT